MFVPRPSSQELTPHLLELAFYVAIYVIHFYLAQQFEFLSIIYVLKIPTGLLSHFKQAPSVLEEPYTR